MKLLVITVGSDEFPATSEQQQQVVDALKEAKDMQAAVFPHNVHVEVKEIDDPDIEKIVVLPHLTSQELADQKEAVKKAAVKWVDAQDKWATQTTEEGWNKVQEAEMAFEKALEQLGKAKGN